MTTDVVVVGHGAAPVRRRLGPTGWVLLEAVVARGRSDGDAIVASVSVRSLAAELGLAKNTVARALVAVRAAGLLTAIQARDAAGTFASGSYLVTVPAEVLAVARHSSRHVRPSHPRDLRVSSVPISQVEQLSLLPQ